MPGRNEGRLARLRILFGAPDLDYPKPPSLEGEEMIKEGGVFFAKSMFNAKSGRLILTNRRLLWGATAKDIWPFRPISGEIDLRDLASVDKGTFLDFLFGGRRLRLRLRSGKDKCLWVDAQGNLDEWIAAIRATLASAYPARVPSSRT